MLFVCLAHFSGAYLAPRGANSSELLALVSMIASPSFVIISGMTTGLLGALFPQSLPHLRRRLFDRGVFLLLAGHALCALAIAQNSGGFANAFRLSFIIDPIALAIMIGPRLVGATRTHLRALLSVALYALGWSLVIFWRAESPAAWSMKYYLAGTTITDAPGLRPISFPLLQWIAIYLLGTILGEHVGRLLRTEPERARRLVLWAGLASVAVGLCLYLSVKKVALFRAPHLQILTEVNLTSPTQKFPPGPAYVLFFGGCGLMLVWFILELECRRARVLLHFLRPIGHSSLVVYLVQGLVYGTLVRRIALSYAPWWPLLYLASIGFLYGVAVLWCRIDGNRFLTVGITSVLESRGGRNRRPSIAVLSST